LKRWNAALTALRSIIVLMSESAPNKTYVYEAELEETTYLSQSLSWRPASSPNVPGGSFWMIVETSARHLNKIELFHRNAYCIGKRGGAVAKRRNLAQRVHAYILRQSHRGYVIDVREIRVDCFEVR